MRGAWWVEPGWQGAGTRVGMQFAFQPSPTVRGRLFALCMQAAFPLVLTTSIILMTPRVGAAATAAAMATAMQGIFIYPPALFLIHRYCVEWGVWWAFLAALVTIVAWAGLVYAWRTSRRG